MQQKYLNLIGLAYKAQKISLGEDTIVKDIQSKRAKLILIARDSSNNTKKKLTDKCHSYHIPYEIIGSIDELSHAIGKENRVAVAILDEGFANRLRQLIND